MKVSWTPEAEQDRSDIWLHIAADNLHAAARMDELFSDAAARPADHPKPGRPGKISGTRELVAHDTDLKNSSDPGSNAEAMLPMFGR